MSDDMRLKKEYQDTFNEVHAPEALSRKVMNMSKENNKKIAVFASKWVAAAALALVVFVGGNGVAYAATGNSLLKTVMIYVNGNGREVELEEKVDEDGNTYYEGSYEVEDGAGYVCITDEIEANDVQLEIIEESAEVVEKDGKLYLVDGEVEIDITEDLADGNASGSYKKDGATRKYEVTGEKDSWSVSISE